MSQPAVTRKPDASFEPRWMISAFQTMVLALTVTEIALAFAVYYNWVWVAIPLVLLASHFIHGLLIGFHEASHGLLRRNRKFNEFDGVLIGTLSLTSFSLYRAAHQTHHMFLSTERDEELWPFVHPASPRWLRILAAFLELFAGLFFTPFLFVRTFFRRNSPIRNKRVRRRVWMEFGLMAVTWGSILGIVAWLQLWKYFLWMEFVPAFIAANLQSWRKYIEHVGLEGSTANGCTRSIITPSFAGRLLAYTLLHEPFHGVHHIHVGLPHDELPKHAEDLQPTQPDEMAPFPNYRSALMHLLRNLPDPRVGAQWKNSPASAPATSNAA
jgi:fatty acid desaturase